MGKTKTRKTGNGDTQEPENGRYLRLKGDRFDKVSTALGIILGAVAGFIAFLPLFAAIRISRRVTSVKMLASATNALLGTAISLALAVAGLLLCSNYGHDVILPFGCAEIVTLVTSISVYVVYKNVLAKRK